VFNVPVALTLNRFQSLPQKFFTVESAGHNADFWERRVFHEESFRLQALIVLLSTRFRSIQPSQALMVSFRV
jgi:hypothetical protein